MGIERQEILDVYYAFMVVMDWLTTDDLRKITGLKPATCDRIIEIANNQSLLKLRLLEDWAGRKVEMT